MAEKENLEEIARRLREMEKAMEEARRKYEEEAARIAKEQAKMIEEAKKRRAELLAELSKIDMFLRAVEKRPRRVVRPRRPAKPGGYMDVLAWIKRNYSVGATFTWSEVEKGSRYKYGSVYKALYEGMKRGYFEKLERGKYKYVSEIRE